MTSTTPSDRVEDLIALDPATTRCPFPVFERLRSEPIAWVEPLGAWFVSRHEDVVRVLRAPLLFSSRDAQGPGSVTSLARRLVADPDTAPVLRGRAQRRLDVNATPVLINADPPDHRRQRSLVNRAFTARRIEALRPFVTAATDDLLDRIPTGQTVDFVDAFAVSLPMRVISHILGVPDDMRDTFKRWSDGFVVGVGSLSLSPEDVEEVFACVSEFYDYFTDQIEQRRAEPRDDLLTAVVTARIDDVTPLTTHEMLQMLVQFLVAGNETTRHLLGWIMLRLATDGELGAAVRADPARASRLVEEVLRLETPSQGLYRVATEDTELGGVAIRAGERVFLSYASANRDADAFPAPESISWERTGDGGHVAFGLGEHFCIGAPLARLEAIIAIQRILDRFPVVELAVAPEEVPLLRSFGHRGLQALPLRFGPAGP